MSGSSIDNPFSDDQAEAETQPTIGPELLTLTEQQFVAWQRSLSDDARALIDQLLLWGHFALVARLLLLALQEGADNPLKVSVTKGS